MSTPTPLTLQTVQKDVIGAIRATERAGVKLRDAGTECAALFVTREEMVAQKEAVEGWIRIGIGADDVLSVEIDRKDKSDKAMQSRAAKLAFRSKVAVYWARLLDYAFPPAKVEKGAQTAKATTSKATTSKATDETTESETVQQQYTPTPDEIQRDIFQGTLTRVVDAIRLARECENPPVGVDMVQAIQFLLGAEAMLAGNVVEAERIVKGLAKNDEEPKQQLAAA